MNIKAFTLLSVLLLIAACAPEPAATDAAKEGAQTPGTAAEMAPAAAAPANDIEARMAAADPAMGQRQYIFCQACHSFDAGGAHKVGPNLHGMFGRGAAQAEGFVYSPALQQSGITWDAATLDQWLANPATMVPGTIMVFAGMNDPVQRANLIAYLQQVTAVP